VKLLGVCFPVHVVAPKVHMPIISAMTECAHPSHPSGVRRQSPDSTAGLALCEA
jgi:hypothetical protein